jgi:hypothetical protein
MSEYKSERLQLNQIMELINSKNYSKMSVVYSVFQDNFLFSITSKDGYVTNNLVTQKNHVRTFKTMKSLCNTFGFDDDQKDIFNLVIC